jgi:hypothetical protein
MADAVEQRDGSQRQGRAIGPRNRFALVAGWEEAALLLMMPRSTTVTVKLVPAWTEAGTLRNWK